MVAEATWPDADDGERERLGGDTFPATDDEATTEGAGAGEPLALC